MGNNFVLLHISAALSRACTLVTWLELIFNWQRIKRSRQPAHLFGQQQFNSMPWQVLGAPALREEFGELAQVDISDAKTGSLADWSEAQRRSSNYEIWRELGPWVEQHRPPFGDDVAPQLRRASEITAEEVCGMRSCPDMCGAELSRLA